MMDPARYGQAMGASPVTVWTKIAKAAQFTSPETKKSLHELITLYDKPLQKLFESIAGHDAASAEDWKQDFVMSHLLTGKVFQAADKRIGRFRTFLAIAVRNYVANRRAGDAAKKRGAESGAKPFSQIGGASDKPFSDRLASPRIEEEYESILTHARALDVLDEAHHAFSRWCAAQQNADDLMQIAEEIKSPATSGLSLRHPSVAKRKVVEQFKDFLRKGVREELLLQPGDNEQFITGREIGILFDALGKE